MAETDSLQEELLKKLTEYGDNMLETRFKSRKKKKRKPNEKRISQTNEIANDGDKINTSNADNNDVVNKAQSTGDIFENEQKKKKRKKKKNTTKLEQEESVPEVKKSMLTGPKKHVDSIYGELGLKQFKSDLQRQGTSDISVLKTDTTKLVNREPEVIVFSSHRHRKPEEKHRPTARQNAEAIQDFDIKQARFEVRKFGLAGFHGDEKEKATTDLLLRLGAKPKKKAYINYKELLEKRKEEMMTETQKREQDMQQGLKVGKRKNRKRDKNDIGSVDGQVGKFVRGVQFIKPNDVQGIKKSKLKVKSYIVCFVVFGLPEIVSLYSKIPLNWNSCREEFRYF